MTRLVCEESLKLIKEHLQEIDLIRPFDEDGAGYNILKFFESIDAEIGGVRSKGGEVDAEYIRAINKIIEEFSYDGLNPLDYENLEKRLYE